MRLPSQPMRRHHYLYGRKPRTLSNPLCWPACCPSSGARRPVRPGSWGHGSRRTGIVDASGSRRIALLGREGDHALYRTKPGDEWVDKKTGEIKPRRYEPDADLHFEGHGRAPTARSS